VQPGEMCQARVVVACVCALLLRRKKKKIEEGERRYSEVCVNM
jgi:hypothetical protein